MKKLKIMLDPKGQREKNTKTQGTQQMRLEEKTIDSVKEFAGLINTGGVGYTWSSMISEKGKRTNEDFKESHFAALDIDESVNLTMDKFMEIAKDICLEPNILYETYSSVGGNRYRVIYRIEGTTNHNLAKLHNLLLFEIFSTFDETTEKNKGIDRGSLQQSKLYQPTNKRVIYNHENVVYLETLMFKALSYTKDKKALMQKIQNNTMIDIKNNWINNLDSEKIFEEKMKADDKKKYAEIIVNYRFAKTDTYNIGILKIKQNITLDKGRMDFTKSANLRILEERCKKYKEMVNGTFGKPSYDEFFNMAVNLCFIKGGQSAMEVIINNCYNTQTSIDDKLKNLNIIADRVKNGTLTNGCCSSANCPYYNKCKNRKPCSVLSVSIQKKDQITFENKELITLDDGRKTLEQNIKDAINKHNTDFITLIKSDCGLGKTYTTIRLFCEYNNLGLFLPTHKKCKEVYEELKKIKKDIIYITPLPDESIVPDNYTTEFREIQVLNSLGFSGEVLERITEIIKSATVIINNKREIEKMKKANTFEKFNEFYRAITSYRYSRMHAKESKFVIATHQYLFKVGGKAFPNIHNIIIDEDCMNSLINTNTIGVSTILKIIDELKHYNNMEQIIEFLNPMLSADTESITVVKNEIKLKKKQIADLATAIENVGYRIDELIKCKSYIRINDRILYAGIQEVKKAESQAIVNLTATPAPSKIIATAFDLDIKVLETENVQLKGKIVQLPYFTAYKKELAKEDYVEKIAKVLDYLDVKNVITYKAHRETFADYGFNTEIYFGNEEGLNTYTGQDVAVVGTYLQNPTATQIIASLTYKEGNYALTTRLTRQRVKRNGIEQTMQTFKDDLLKEIQLHALESKIIQAAGRSRSISTDATVYIFASLVHPLATVCYSKPEDSTVKILDDIEDIILED